MNEHHGMIVSGEPDVYRCECRALFPSEAQLRAHLVRADEIEMWSTAEVAEILEECIEDTSEHNNSASPRDMISVEDMCLRIADRLQDEFFMIRWTSYKGN